MDLNKENQDNNKHKQPIEDKPWLNDSGGVKSNGAKASAHYQEACNRLSEIGQRSFKLIEFDDNEDLVAEIRRHWFGHLMIWLVGIISTSILVLFPLLLTSAGSNMFVLGDNIFSGADIDSILIVISIVLGVISLSVTFALARLFTLDVIFVTTDKIAQVKHKGLIHRKVSQLGIGDVQDVSIHQQTLASRIFNYGRLVVETAGEQNDFSFNYVPNPPQNTRAIIWAREENMKRYGN